MKKFIYKNISVILSIALVLGVMLPCLSGVMTSAYSEENTVVKNQLDAAADTLISEWKALTGEEENFAYPYKWINNDNTTVVSSFDEVSDPEGVSLGGKTTVVTVSDTSVADGKAKVVFAFDPNLGVTSDFAIGDIEDIVFWLKTDAAIEASMYFNSPSYSEPYNNFTLGSETKSFKNSYTFSTPISSRWKKVSVRTLMGEEAYLAWRETHASGLFIRFNADFALAGAGDMANVSLGGVCFTRNIEQGVPKNAESLTPYELLDEAANVDTSGFADASAFISARTNLATLIANAFDPIELKTAWGKVSRLAMPDYLYPYGIINSDNTRDDEDLYSDAVYFREGTDGVTTYRTAVDERFLFGEKTATFDFALGKDRTSITTSDTQYTTYMSCDPDSLEEDKLHLNFATTKHLHGADDLQFSFIINEINTAATGAKIGFRITGTYNGTFGVRKTDIAFDINESIIGKVNTVKFSELAESAGITDWQEAYTSGGDTISRIEIQLYDSDSANNVSVNMTLGTAVTILYSDVPGDDETKNWNIADWVYAAKSVNLTDCYNTEEFLAAIESAEELREISGVEPSTGITTHASASTLSFGAFGDNLLAGITPDIKYYDGVSDYKDKLFTSEYEELADGNLTSSIALQNADFSNEGAFVEYEYDLKRINAITKAAVVSAFASAQRVYKYKLYMARTEGELYTADSLIATYTNRGGSQAQVFDCSEETVITARYISFRIYTPALDMASYDGVVRINELGVWGYAKDYDVHASDYSVSRIEALGKNLISKTDVKPFVRANTGNRQKFKGLFDEEKYPLSNVFDNDINTAIAVSGNYRMKTADDTTSLHIYFDLGTAYSIDKFLLSSIGSSYHEIGKYDIHASNDLNKLFGESTVIVNHDNTVDTTKMQIFTMKTPVIARYVSFHITLAVSDYEALMAKYGKLYEGACIRISELGIFGEEYIKPPVKQNILAHTPMELNRIDESGNKTAIGEDEYSGETHKLTFDGDYETAVTVTSEGKKLEYFYSLYDDASIESLRVVTASESVSELKFYMATAKSAIDNDAALVYSYSKAEDGAQTAFNKNFVEAPRKASYIKIVATVSGDFDPTEIEAIGWDSGRGAYENLALNNSSYMKFFLMDTETKAYETDSPYFDVWLPAWSYWEDYYDYPYALDGDLGSIYTYFGGENNKTSVNIYVNLQTTSYVDNVSIYTGALEDYRPSKMNLYIGTSIDDLFAADATPVKQWTEKVTNVYEGEEEGSTDDGKGEDIVDGSGSGDDDEFVDYESGLGTGSENVKTLADNPANLGLYSADFRATRATCIRIEIVESNPTYFSHLNKVGGIISEIMVNGYEVTGNAADSVIDAAEDMTMRAFDPTAYQAYGEGSNIIKEPIAMGSYNSEPVVLVKGIGDNVAYSSCTPGYGYVEFSSTSDMTADVSLADIEDIYFSYKVEKAYTEGSAAARIYIFDSDGRYANSFASTGTSTVLYIPTDNTEWVNTSMSEVTGENWKDAVVESFNTLYGYSGDNAFTQADISINKIRFGFNKAAAADIVFGSMYYEFNEGCNPYANAITMNLGANNQDAALSPSAYYSDARYTPEILSGEYTGEYVSIKGIGTEVAHQPCASTLGYVEWTATSNVAGETLDNIQDIYFSYKVDKAISGTFANARMYVFDQNGRTAYEFASTGTSTVFYLPLDKDEWTETSFRQIAGGNWKQLLIDAFSANYGTELKAEDITISQIRFGFNFVGAGDISFSAMYYEYDDISSAAVARANSVLSSARGLIDPETATKESAREFKYSVDVLADYLGAGPVYEYGISGDYKATEPTMKDLALLAQYLDGTLGSDDYIDLTCADVNKDGKINENDVILLRKMLMGIS